MLNKNLINASFKDHSAKGVFKDPEAKNTQSQHPQYYLIVKLKHPQQLHNPSASQKQLHLYN